jgi:Haem-binding uptake, Tiki superfamily, ChaN
MTVIGLPKGLGNAEPLPDDTEIRKALDGLRPLEPLMSQALRGEIEEAHCHLLRAPAIGQMVFVQRARDAYLAKAMLTANNRNGAVLIAGAGHVRKGWAVPRILHDKLPDASMVSVAFIEVDPEQALAAKHVPAVSGPTKPFDFLYFTPAADLTDHCSGLKQHLKR